MSTQVWLTLVIFAAVILVISVIGDIVLEYGPFWVFWVINTIVMVLFLMLMAAIKLATAV